MTSYYGTLSSTKAGVRLDTVGTNALEFNNVDFYRSEGTLKAPAALATADSIVGGINAYGYTGSAFRRLVQIEAFANSTAAASGRLTLGTYNTTNNAMNNLLTLNNGSLAITAVTGVTIESSPTTNISIGTTLTSGKIILGQDNTNIDLNGILNANDGINGTLLTASQPNVTSLGELTGLTMNGIITSATGTDLRLRTIASQAFYIRDSSNADKMEITNAGKITLNATASQQLLLQQGGADRFSVSTVGLTRLDSAPGQDIQLITANNPGGTSGAVRLTSGTGTTGGVIALNAQGTTPGTINLRQNGTDRVVVGAGGDTRIFLPAGSSGGGIYHNSLARFTTSDAATLVQTPATATASTNSATVTLSTGNATGTTSNSGAITLTTGTATGSGGNIVLNTQGTTLGTINLQQAGASRLLIGTTGAIDINAAASQQLRLQQGGTTRLDLTSAGQVLLDSASAQSIELRQAGTARLAATNNNEIILDSGAAKGTAIRQGGTDMINITEAGLIRFSAASGQSVDSRVAGTTRLSVGANNVTVTPSSSGTLVVAARGITLPNPTLAAYTFLSNHSVATVPLVFGESTGSRTFTVSCIVMRVGAHAKIRFRTLATNFIPSAATGQYFSCFDSNLITDIYMTGLYNAQITNFRAVRNTTYSDAAIFEDSFAFIILKTLDSTDFGDPANYFGPFNGTTDEWNFRSFDLDIISNNTSNAAA